MIPISIQLWSLRDLTSVDFTGTMKQLAAFGYAGVETAGYGNLNAEEAAAAVKAAGLRCSGMHVGIDRLRGDLTQVVVEARMFETRDVICPWMHPALFDSAESAEQIGRELDGIGAALRGFGIRLHYHNHASEFVILDGRPAIDWLLDAAAPANLGCQADVYWVQSGGKDPATFIREQGRRIRLLHLKDEMELGSGPVDFLAVFDAVDGIGALEWYVVECEKHRKDPLDSARVSIERLRKWGKA
jgi:sugar phosphate isomerase/epimerase